MPAFALLIFTLLNKLSRKQFVLDSLLGVGEFQIALGVQLVAAVDAESACGRAAIRPAQLPLQFGSQ